MPPKSKGRKAVARKMPPPLPTGEVLTDGIKKQQWVIGSSIGKGGFGEIYMATPKGQDLKKAEHVIKIEPHENGPLFCELSYYRRVAKEETINRWVTNKGLKYLPCPKFITCGSHNVDGVMYRFLVMQRFGDDIERHFRAASRFCEDTVSYLALRLLEGLEFLHESEYVHADIKGSNMLTGLGREADRVYLVDYGLAYRFSPDGNHKEYKEDPKKAHDGTIEFTSIDAHKGVSPSRRGDLEILGYCLLQWTCGRLPWEDNLTDVNYVARRKKEYHGDAAKLVRDCYGSNGSKALQNYMAEVYKLQYTDMPPYSKLKRIFEDQLRGRDPKRTLEWLHPKAKPAKPIKCRSEEGPSELPVKYRKLSSPISLALPRMLTAKMHLQSSSEGSDLVDSGEKVKGKKAKKRASPSTTDDLPKAKKAKNDRLPKGKKAQMDCPPLEHHLPKGKAKMDGPDHLPKGKAKMDGPDRLPKGKAKMDGPDRLPKGKAKLDDPDRLPKGKKAKMDSPPLDDHFPKGKAKLDDPDRLPKRKKAKMDGPPLPKGKKSKIDLPEAWYPPELGYTSEKKDAEGADPGFKESRGTQGKGKHPPSRENGGASREEEAVSPPRRSDRNQGKVINYAQDLSSSFNNSRGATVSFQDSSDEEGIVEITRAAPSTKRKRKRT